MKSQTSQKQIFAARYVNLNSIANQASARSVQTKRTKAEIVGRSDSGTTRCGSESRNQLGKREGFGEVVVSACIQTNDNVVLLIQRGEHDDSGTIGSRTEMLRDGVSAASRQSDVEHNGVIVLCVYKLLTLFGRGRSGDGMAVLPEPSSKEFEHAKVVFDDENA